MYQQRYWTQLKHLRTHVFYLHLYATKADRNDKLVNIFLAVASSSSIAAWALWQEYKLLWAFIIAAAQVVTAVKPFLPFRQRVKAVTALNDSLQTIALESERYWFHVSEGLFGDEEIHDKVIDIAGKISKAEQKCMSGVVLPHDKGILSSAEIEADKYLRSHYHGE
jgi:hypothetical protein